MNISKLFLTTLTVVAISGCSTSAKQAQQARAYQDIDGSVQEIIFTDHTLNEQQLNDIRVARGQAANKKGVIGEIYALRDGSGLLLTDGTKSFSPYESTEMRMLANAKAFDLYEFGRGHMGHAKFSAKNGMCKDFNGKNGINLTMATNYYDVKSLSDYHTLFVNVDINNKVILSKDIGYKASFTTSDKAVDAKMREAEKQSGQKVALSNIEKTASILLGICK
jgi:hypothetical protein